MRLAILCPGPSLARGESAAWKDYDLTLAVNRAAAAHPCDWWVFGDPEGFHQTIPQGHPNLCTPRRSWAKTCNPGIEGYWWVLAFEEIDTDVRLEFNWRNHSLTAAMVLAEWLTRRKARLAIHETDEIDIFGCDWKVGADYYDGGVDPIAHHAHRFEGERHAYGRVAQWIAGKGIELRRQKFDFAGVGKG